MKINEGFLKQIQFALYCIFAWLGFISNSAACDAALQKELLAEYVTNYHALWGEQSPRDLVETILNEFSVKFINILENNNSKPCRFSQIIKRPLQIRKHLE